MSSVAAVDGTDTAEESVTRFRCADAWVNGAPSGPVDIQSSAGRITKIGPVESQQPAEVLPGLVFAGFADAHSHVFHRALRGRTHGEQHGGSFWTWRQAMYAVAERLDPDRLRALAVAAYAELVCSGYTAVGEFHYLHHRPDGRQYDEPNAMGIALADAAAQAQIRLTLLDTVYLAGGFNTPPSGVQQRFSDGSAEQWALRFADLPGVLPPNVRVGAAIHSVRAVPVAELPAVVAATDCLPLHVHLSEQPTENADSLAATGLTPTALLASAGVLRPGVGVVHATHLTDADIAALSASGAIAVICPTTEADLADGLPRIGALAAAGVPLACGGDQQVIVDPFAQARGIEYGERLATGRRGTLAPAALVHAATATSHRVIGSPAGELAVGAPADFVCVRTESARTAGVAAGQLVMAASAADVAVVVIGGRVVARDGIHQVLGDPGPLLSAAIDKACG